MGDWVGSSWSWNLIWRRTLFDWELEEVVRLNNCIARIHPQSDAVDGVSWRNSGYQSFPIKCIADKFYERYPPILSKPIIDIVWKSCIPPRAQLTLWLTSLEKLKTGDKLANLGILNAQQALCPFCCLEIESILHILFSCRFSWCVWMEVLKWWGINGALQNSCGKFTVEWGGLLKPKNWKKLWRLILGCVIWSLWFERNKTKFKMHTPVFNHFVYSLKIRIGAWTQELLGLKVISPHDLVHKLEAVIS